MLSNLLCSLVKLVDSNAVPVGFRVAAVMLKWDYATVQWVLCKPRVEHAPDGDGCDGCGVVDEGGIMQWL